MIQILLLIICGLVLLWFGHFLFFGPMSPIYPYMPWSKKEKLKEKPGDPQICPLCSMKMLNGENLKTTAFPAKQKSTDRLIHIKGCSGCLERNLPRMCPVCRTKLSVEDFLVARMFERSFQKNHVHVLGCNKCRKI